MANHPTGCGKVHWRVSAETSSSERVNSDHHVQSELNLTMKAIWNGQKIAESDETVVVEGNHYFPMSAVDMSFLIPSKTKTKCPWKGVARYYTINVGVALNIDACWYYPKPKEAAKKIQEHVAFWRGVEVTG